MKLARLAAGSIAVGTCCACGFFGAAPAHDATTLAKKREAVAYQINTAHSGSITLSSKFAPPFKQLWSVNLGGPISYPIIADGLVIVTVGNTGSYGTQLYALDRKTGATVWQVAISGTYFWSNAAYDAGNIFVVNYDGALQEYAAKTGAAGWSVQLQGQYAFSSPPTAEHGQIFVGGAGSGGTLYAVSEADGSTQWTQSVANGDNSSPALGAGGVYVSYPCQYYSFAPSNGKQIWHYDGGCDGGGGKTPVYIAKRVFVRDPDSSNIILSAKKGTSLGTFSAGPAPAFFTDSSGNSYGVALSSGTLTCFDLTSQNVVWTFTGDGDLTTAPLVVNGQVFEGSGEGDLYVLDGVSGTTLWSTNIGTGIPAPDEQNVSQPLTGLGAGENTLVVPAGDELFAFVRD